MGKINLNAGFSVFILFRAPIQLFENISIFYLFLFHSVTKKKIFLGSKNTGGAFASFTPPKLCLWVLLYLHRVAQKAVNQAVKCKLKCTVNFFITF